MLVLHCDCVVVSVRLGLLPVLVTAPLVCPLTDYESLRIGGLVFAATICILGIVLVFSEFGASSSSTREAAMFTHLC